VLRLTVDCGDEPQRLLLEVVMADSTARGLARTLSAGQRIRASGTLKAVGRGAVGAVGRQQIEVVASEIVPERMGGESRGAADLLNKLI
jgi:hypothetical protein